MITLPSREQFACDFVQVYGLTEVSGPGTFLNQEDHRLAASTRPELLRSAGRPIGECRMRSSTRSPARTFPKRRRERCGWKPSATSGLARPEGDARRLPGRTQRACGGWFRTGDAGYVKDGYLYINDRIKDMIISGGENIYPAEIENVLTAHPAVSESR